MGSSRGHALAVLGVVVAILVAGCAVDTGSLNEPAPVGGETTHTVPPSASEPAEGIQVTVVEVVDGDTIKIAYENGTRDTARLLGVDTPEVHGENEPGEFEGVPDTEAGASCLRDWGYEASDFATNRLEGQQVTLTFDDNEPRRGYYDRLLVYVHHDGTEFNYALVTNGLARVYDDSTFTRKDRYDTAESVAMTERRGLWTCSDPDATTTGSGTETGTPTDVSLAVAEFNYDAGGDDRENLTGEYVVLENRGDEPLNLSGWTARDEAGHTYMFPDGLTLDPDEEVTLHTGSGEDGDGHLYWGHDSPVWNNDGDTLVVRTADGTVVLEKGYG